jgi:hypothetical protein
MVTEHILCVVHYWPNKNSSLFIVVGSYCGQGCEIAYTEWKCMSLNGIKMMYCSKNINLYLQKDRCQCYRNILSYTRLQASCPHTEVPHDCLQTLSPKQNIACLITYARDSSITVGVSNGDFVLKQLQIGLPTKLTKPWHPCIFLMLVNKMLQYRVL